MTQGTEELHPQLIKQARASGQLNLSNRQGGQGQQENVTHDWDCIQSIHCI